MSAAIVVFVVFVVPMSANWFGADVAMSGAIMGAVTPVVFAMMGAGLVMNLYGSSARCGKFMRRS